MSADSISGKSIYYQDMYNGFAELVVAAANGVISQRDVDAMRQYMATVENAHRSIIESQYHEEVEGFLDGINIFAALVNAVFPVSAPERFDIVVG